MEPQCPYAHSRLEPRGDSAFSAPAFSSGGQASGSEGLAASTSTQPFGVTTTTKFKLPAALRRKQNVSKPTSSIITKRQGAARTSFKKKRRLVPKGRSTAGGSILVANNDKNSRVVSDKGECFGRGSFIIPMLVQVSTVRWVSPLTDGKSLFGVVSPGLPRSPGPEPGRVFECSTGCSWSRVIGTSLRMRIDAVLELVLHSYPGTALGPDRNLVLHHRRSQMVVRSLFQSAKINAPLLLQGAHPLPLLGYHHIRSPAL
ncbi:hypothetical protein EDB87DRAFT_1209572 [Lactarius vividus]|nr:hypothetical protein EDB87DRAFT_1209572 [Lactarius vividus]